MYASLLNKSISSFPKKKMFLQILNLWKVAYVKFYLKHTLQLDSCLVVHFWKNII